MIELYRRDFKKCGDIFLDCVQENHSDHKSFTMYMGMIDAFCKRMINRFERDVIEVISSDGFQDEFGSKV